MKPISLRLLSVVAGSLFLSSAQAGEVQTYIIAKGQQFHQTNAASAVLFTNESAHRFVSSVEVSETNTISDVSLLLPNKQTRGLTNSENAFELEEGFTNKTQLDAAFAKGNYTLTIKSAAEGTNKSVLTLPADLYPGAPHLLNWPDLQEVEADQPLTLQWDGFTNGTASDLIFMNIDRVDGDSQAGTPALLETNALTGTNLSFQFPAETFEWNTNYEGRLFFVKRTGNYTNGFAGAKGLSGYYRETKFALATLSEPPSHGRIQFSTRNFSASENSGAAAITITRSGAEGHASVSFTTSDGTALDGRDYTGLSTTLHFQDNETVKTVPLELINNFLLDGSRTVNLTLANPTGGSILGNRNTAVLTILDNEIAAAGKLQFAVRSNSVAESIKLANVSVTRTSGTAGAVSVDFTTADGTALAGQDYVATNGTLTFAAGQTSRIIPVKILNDSLDETNESFYLHLNATAGGAALGTNTLTIVTIRNDDVAGLLAFKSAALTTNENATNFVVTVVRTGGKASGVTVDFATQNGSALADLDYVPTNGTLTFGSNELSKTFLVGIHNDTLIESNETFNVRLSNPTGRGNLGALTNILLTIRDDESSVSFTNASYTVTEAGPAISINVIRTGALFTPVSVDYSTADISANAPGDYTGTNGTLTFPANATFKTIVIPIKNDTLAESSEAFSVTLLNPQGGVQLGALTNTIVTILDNDLGGVINFLMNSYTVGEAGTNASITLVRSNGLASAVTVDFLTANGTASAGSDYTDAAQTVVFAAGETSKKVLVPILNDTLVEGNETVLLSLTTATGGASLGLKTNAVLTIVDDDLGGVISFKATSISTNENAGNFVVAVTRTGGKASGVSVDYFTQAGTATATADYASISDTLTFAANETNKTILIAINNDTLAEGTESFTLNLTNVLGGATLGAITNTTLTIVDDESSLSLTNASYVVSEAGTNVAITIVRSGALLTAVSVDFATLNGTATAPSDFIATNGTLTFLANVSSKTILIPIVNDTIVESTEAFQFRLSNPLGGVQLGTLTNATVTITNDDFAGTIQFASSGFSGTEGSGPAIITITRTGGLASGVSVFFNMAGVTATSGVDYTNVASQFVTFGAGETNKTLSVGIVADALNESTETANLYLSSPLGGATLGSTTTATLSIFNKPDPDAVPIAGPLFMKWTANGVPITVNPLLLAPAADSHGGNLILTGTFNTLSDYKTLLMDVGPSVPGTLHLTDAGLNGFCSYTVGPFTAVGTKMWVLGTSSSNNGATGTFIYDAIDHTAKRVSGRFNLHLREEILNAQGDVISYGGFIDVIGSFRITLQ